MKCAGNNKALDIRALAFKIRKANPDISLDEMTDIIMKMPAPKFYVTLEVTKRIISNMARGKGIAKLNPYKIAMYTEIYRRYKEYEKDIDPDKGKYAILDKIISGEAPSFYVSKDTIRSFISCSEARAIEKNNRWYL